VNVEAPIQWLLAPGAERDLVGGAIRSAIDVRSDSMSDEFHCMLRQLDQSPLAGEDEDSAWASAP
jgi:hypothetical protein